MPPISSPAVEFFCYDPSGYPPKNNNMANIDTDSTKIDKADPPTVALYISCLINSLHPQIGFQCAQLIEAVGYVVEVPPDQTCCGQPGYNGGHRQQSAAIARQQIALLEGYDFVVVPSGSCAGMIINHYPALLAEDPHWKDRAERVAERTRELCQFLVDQHWQPARISRDEAQKLAYHTSCSCRRETKSHQHGETLLRRAGYRLAPLQEQEVCCGFGGSFAAKFNELSSQMGRNKLDAVKTSQANALVSADLGCLLHLESLNGKGNEGLHFYHIAELLAATCQPRSNPA